MVRWVVNNFLKLLLLLGEVIVRGARCSSVVKAFTHGAMGRKQLKTLLLLLLGEVIARGMRCSSVVRAFAHGAMGRKQFFKIIVAFW